MFHPELVSYLIPHGDASPPLNLYPLASHPQSGPSGPASKPEVFLALSSGQLDLTVYPLVTAEADLIKIWMCVDTPSIV